MIEAQSGLHGLGVAAFNREPAIGPREYRRLRQIQEQRGKLDFYLLSAAHQPPDEEHNSAADDQSGAKQRQQNKRDEIGYVHLVAIYEGR